MNVPIAVEIIRHGCQVAGHGRVNPGDSPILREAGNAIVTRTIEKLVDLGFIGGDVEPLFSSRGGGMWIGYRLSDDGRRLGDDPEEIRLALERGGVGYSELRKAFASLRRGFEESTRCRAGIGDLLATIGEIGVCFDAGCPIATVILSGKLLEICLREELLDRLGNGAVVEENLGIGALLARLREFDIAQYRAENMNNVANLIKSARNAAAHARDEAVPVPSQDQAASVAYAVRDVAMRRLSAG